MKFSKKMMAVAVLVSTQAVVLFGLPPTRGAAASATRPVPGRPAEEVRPVGPAPALPPKDYPMESVSFGQGLDISKVSLQAILDYLNLPASERTLEKLNTARDAHKSLDNYLSTVFREDNARFVDTGKVAEAKKLFTKAVSELVGSNWNMITKRPIMKNKYEQSVIVSGVQYLNFGQNNFNDIKNILNQSLSSKMTGNDLDKYVNELVAKIAKEQSAEIKGIDWQGMREGVVSQESEESSGKEVVVETPMGNLLNQISSLQQREINKIDTIGLNDLLGDLKSKIENFLANNKLSSGQKESFMREIGQSFDNLITRSEGELNKVRRLTQEKETLFKMIQNN
jgi:hypothetical protein